ncbi:YjbF family lipoprotein [Stenotrophomonas sp. Iso1]|uniref:YjbF family lipoprotein n=1 Tax=Stenotrophomonas sp. Iso1 TaxID=2977283 RepID=UPI0022B78F51|nr:YjbF family lipoprotein [Stenotrophomonas sp. Iso1]
MSMLLVAITMSGCGAIGQSSIKAVRLAIQGTPDVQATAREVAANRFPQIKVTGPNGGAILVLGNLDDGRQAWYSSERSIVFLRDGVIVATHGGIPELRQMAIIGANPFHDLRQLKPGTRVERRYDVMPGHRYGMRVTGHLQKQGREPVQILGRTRELEHVRERLNGHGWKRDNHYWVDPANGFIWKSVQAIGPDTSLELIQFKPYAPDLRTR